jgi:IS30 family transposase
VVRDRLLRLAAIYRKVIARHLLNEADSLVNELCHETIYQALHLGRKGGLSRTLTAKLRTGRPLRKRRRKAHQRATRFLAPTLLIHSRPEVVETRTRIGDWEGDLIVGRSSRSAIGTLVCRSSRALRLVHLPNGHCADALIEAITPVLQAIPSEARCTLTWDQGSEMARHDLVAEHFHQGVFFAEPGSPWQRLTNENTTACPASSSPRAATYRSTHTRTSSAPSSSSTSGRDASSTGRPPTPFSPAGLP